MNNTPQPRKPSQVKAEAAYRTRRTRVTVPLNPGEVSDLDTARRPGEARATAAGRLLRAALAGRREG